MIYIKIQQDRISPAPRVYMTKNRRQGLSRLTIVSRDSFDDKAANVDISAAGIWSQAWSSVIDTNASVGCRVTSQSSLNSVMTSINCWQSKQNKKRYARLLLTCTSGLDFRECSVISCRNIARIFAKTWTISTQSTLLVPKYLLTPRCNLICFALNVDSARYVPTIPICLPTVLCNCSTLTPPTIPLKQPVNHTPMIVLVIMTSLGTESSSNSSASHDGTLRCV